MQRSIHINLLLVILLILVTLFFSLLLSTKPSVQVSMAELLANPEKFHGKHISTEGVWQYEFEDHNLYFNEESRTDMINNLSIWLEIPNEIHNQYYEQLVKTNGRYVSISGIFNAEENGHYGMSQGSFEKILSCEIID